MSQSSNHVASKASDEDTKTSVKVGTVTTSEFFRNQADPAQLFESGHLWALPIPDSISSLSDSSGRWSK